MKQIGNPLELVLELTTAGAKNSSRATKPDPEVFRKEGWTQFRSFQKSLTDYTNERITEIGMHPRPSS